MANKSNAIVGLREQGFRSNGLSLVRRIMQNLHGENWHEANYEGISVAKLALHPSKIYTGAVVEMFGGYDREPKVEVHGVAHITGGGLPGKLGRILKPSTLGAQIDEPFDPSKLMLYCQEQGNVPDREAYTTWNMGQGLLVITPQPDQAIEVAGAHGIQAKVIGTITTDPRVRIKNRGYNSKGEYLNFDPSIPAITKAT